MKLPWLLVATSLLSPIPPLRAQNPLFQKVPSADDGSPHRVPFPALQRMRCAWGDFNNDGWLDVIISGQGEQGPVTRLYQNTHTDGASPGPFSFLEVTPADFPQVQDGALAWGDFDNDGFIDLALTGSRTAEPAAGDLVAKVYRNLGLNAGGFHAGFQDIMAGPWLKGCRWGLLQWVDMDHDGDLDLLYSGDSSPAWVAMQDRERATRIFRNESGVLTGGGPVLTIGDYPLTPGLPGREVPGILAIRADWHDFDRDGVNDLILTSLSEGFGHGPGKTQVWLNRSLSVTGPTQFVRHGPQWEHRWFTHPAIGDWAQWPKWNPAAPDPTGGLHDWPGAVSSDWDSDGWMEAAVFVKGQARFFHETSTPQGLTMISRVTDFLESTQVRSVPTGPFSPAAFPDDLIPEYRPLPLTVGGLTFSDPFEQEVRQPLRMVSADFLGTGGNQLLATMVSYGGSLYSPDMAFLTGGSDGALGDVGQTVLGIPPRLAGCLEAVDVDRDGRMDVFISGYDEDLDWATELYRNANPHTPAPPTVPANVRIEDQSPTALHIAWDPATDPQTPTAALRYGVSVRNITAGVNCTPALCVPHRSGIPGNDPILRRRLVPGTSGLQQMTGYVLRREPGRTFPPGTYRVEVRAFDSAGLSSGQAGVVTFTISDPVPVSQMDAGVPWRDTVLEAGDMDNDGDLDVVVAGHSRTVFAPHADTTGVLRNDGSGNGSLQFQTVAMLPPLEKGAMRWGDADGDGDLDLAMSGISHGQPMTRIYRNAGGGVFTLWQALDPVENSALEWVDFDNDGDLDLMVSGYHGPKPSLRLYQNQNGNFVRIELWTQQNWLLDPVPQMGRGTMAWVDFDGDGDLDVFLCGDTQDYTITPPTYALPWWYPPDTQFAAGPGVQKAYKPVAGLYLNEGPGPGGRGWVFRPVSVSLPPVVWDYQSFSGGMIARAEWSDLDADGMPDLVLAGYRAHPSGGRHTQSVAWALRNEGPDPATLGGYRFSERSILPINHDVVQTLTCADWDHDGLPDILMSGHTQGAGGVSARILHNDGMAFSRTTHLQADTPGGPRYFGGLAAFGHFSEDPHRLDVMVNGMWGWITSTLEYDSMTRVFPPPGGKNAPPSIPTGLNAVQNGNAISFSWNPSTDTTTPAAALTYNLSVERTDGLAGGMPGMADPGTGRRLVERVGNVGRATTWTLRNLHAGSYQWRVQALDAALTPSGFASAPQTFVAGPPVPPGGPPPPPLTQYVQTLGGVTTMNLSAVVAARNVRIATGGRGRILFAPRGQPFRPVASGVLTDLHDVAIGPDAAIAVGEGGVILRSPDGRSWESMTSPTSQPLLCLAHGSAGWVALGDGVAVVSPDGIQWSMAHGPVGGRMREVAFAAGRYVAVGGFNGSQKILTSMAGNVWVEVTPSGLPSGDLTGVDGDAAGFLAVGGVELGSPSSQRRDLLTSTDGLTWTLAASLTGQRPLRKVARAAGWWAGVSRIGTLRSVNGLSWEDTPMVPGDDQFTNLAVDGSRITTTGVLGRLRTTEDAGATWLMDSGGRSYHVTSLAHGNGLTVAVGEREMLMVSADGGLTWSGQESLNSFSNYAVAFGNGRFVIAGDRSQVSTDGHHWSRVTLPFSGVRTLVFGGGRFVAANLNGNIAWSTDGMVWHQVVPQPSAGLARALAFGNGTFVLMETDGRILTSPDGATWIIRDVVAQNLSSLTFAHDRFFATGMGLDLSGRIYTSGDGVTWQGLPPLAPGAQITGVIRFGGRWLAWGNVAFVGLGTFNGLMLESEDLQAWTAVPVPTSAVITSLLVQPGGLIIAGRNRTLLLSPDGGSVPLSPLLPLPEISFEPGFGAVTRGLTLSGRQGQTVLLQVSDALGPWTTVETITLRNDTETGELIEPVPADRRFFRLAAP